jgi:hypothetical protein
MRGFPGRIGPFRVRVETFLGRVKTFRGRVKTLTKSALRFVECLVYSNRSVLI